MTVRLEESHMTEESPTDDLNLRLSEGSNKQKCKHAVVTVIVKALKYWHIFSERKKIT